jgi:predicted nucleic acid-binding protein
MRLYLDACCLTRPLDDLSIARNRLEADAVLEIFRRVQLADWTAVGSEALALELNLIPDADHRNAAEVLLAVCNETAIISPEVDRRAEELASKGFGAMDAYHLAAAEAANCDVFLTTDDRLIRKAKSPGISLRIQVMNPLQWIQEHWYEHG